MLWFSEWVKGGVLYNMQKWGVSMVLWWYGFIHVVMVCIWKILGILGRFHYICGVFLVLRLNERMREGWDYVA